MGKPFTIEEKMRCRCNLWCNICSILTFKSLFGAVKVQQVQKQRKICFYKPLHGNWDYFHSIHKASLPCLIRLSQQHCNIVIANGLVTVTMQRMALSSYSTSFTI